MSTSPSLKTTQGQKASQTGHVGDLLDDDLQFGFAGRYANGFLMGSGVGDAASMAASSGASVSSGLVSAAAAPTSGTGTATTGGTAAPSGSPTTGAGSTVVKGTATPAWVSALTDAGIKADMTAATADGTVTYSEMLNVLTDVDNSLSGKSSGLSAAQFSDLKTIMNNWSNGVSMSTYVHDVANRLVNGDAANAKYTGGGVSTVALGNLGVGSTYTQVNELIG